MPAYVTHAIMATDVYNNGIKDLRLFKTKISLNNIRTYSLGTDLSSFSITNFKSHNKNTRDFFLNMIIYIKTNHLENDGKVMSMLYGHIAHYFLDVNVHPLVNSLNNNTYNSTILSNHTLIEGFYDSYLLKKKKKESSSIKLFSMGNLLHKECVETVNYTYNRCYKVNNVISSYRKVISLFSLIEKTTRGLLSSAQLKVVSGFDRFMKLNSITSSDLLVDNGQIWIDSITGEIRTESFNDLYTKSINDTLSAIEEVNEYLYGNKFISHLENIFEDLSYDTGKRCLYKGIH